MRDDEVIAAADEAGLPWFFTSMRTSALTTETCRMLLCSGPVSRRFWRIN